VENTTDSTITLYLKVTDATTGETIKFANSLTLTGNGYELGYIDNTDKSGEN
jgi:hypothetical protein